MEVSELAGRSLDWAVKQCELLGGHITMGEYNGKPAVILNNGLLYCDEEWFCPSVNWSQGGPIIEREKITPHADFEEWVAQAWQSNVTESGDTLLVAAMRCYVSLKAGDSIEIPEELC